jgi:HAMP domain-containing protein
MTIRLQNLVIIPPIFLILALAVGFLADRAAREEILWGLHQESVALAVTVADMTGGATIDRLSTGDALAERRAMAHLRELAGHGQVEAIVLYSRAAGHAVLSWDRDSTALTVKQALWTSKLTNLKSQEVVGGVGPWGPYPEALVAAAPIYASGNPSNPRGVAAVIIDASRMTSATQALRRDFALLVLLVTGLGIAAALFLSVRIGRQVRELGRVGATVAAGEYRAPVQVSGVKEVQDLSNTLGTMASILSDVLSRGRRALLVGDAFQLSHNMAAAYKEVRLDGAPPPEGLEVGYSSLGEISPGCFHGWTETPRHTVLWVGEVSAGDSLDLAIEAAAANRVLERGLRHGSPEEVAGSISNLFHLSALQIAWFTRPIVGDPEVRVAAGTGAPLTKGDYCVIHSFQSEHMDSLSGSLSLFKDLPAEQAAKEVPLALPRTFSGALLLIRPLRPSSEGDTS